MPIGCSPAEEVTPSGTTGAEGAADGPNRSPPNVLFYLVDTLRADRMGVYGYERANTPFLSELAEHAVVFENCYSQGPWTKPSMAALLTSQYATEVGVRRKFERLHDDVLTFPEVLRENGWHTAGFSANPLVGQLSNFAQGFELFVEASEVNWGRDRQWSSGSAERLNRRVMKWLTAGPQVPAFLYVHAVDPHAKYEPDARYLQEFADPALEEQYRQWWDTLSPADRPGAGNHVTQTDFDESGIEAGPFIGYGSDLYDADILACDEQIQWLWSKLAVRGWKDRCVAIITSDHGEEFFEHGGTSHAYSLYNELLHVPLIIYAPGLVPAGLRVKQPVRSIDIYPTLLDLLGLEVPPGLRGRSLVPLMQGDESWQDEDVYAEMAGDPVSRDDGTGAGQAMVLISGGWKFISNVKPSVHRNPPRFELYHLSEDPGETRNLAEERPEIVRLFQDKMTAHWAEVLEAKGDEVDLDGLDEQTLENLRELGYLEAR